MRIISINAEMGTMVIDWGDRPPVNQWIPAELTDGTERSMLEIVSILEATKPEKFSGDVSALVALENPYPEQEVPNWIQRSEEVDKIVVTTESGRVFDGDEKAQNRMARAVTAGAVGEKVRWKLADNTFEYVSREELKEALRLAGLVQTEIWSTFTE